MIINLLQHLFKWAIYPIYEGEGFSVLSTAYNVCALLIILMPIAFLSKSVFLRDYVFVAGAFAGFITNVIPYWHIGIPVSELGWEYARFYICHSLLFFSGMLPLLLGMHRLSYRRSPKIALGFILSLGIIILNDIISIALGICYDYTLDGLYEALFEMNPAMSMHPIESFPIIEKIARALSPAVFFPEGSGSYVPILWYVIPVFIGFTLLAFTVIVSTQFKVFISDCKKLKTYIKSKLKL
jgi:hypothetical protein